MTYGDPKALDILSRISILAFDFDGVFTDGMVYVDQHGNESVRCSRKDGLGIRLLRRHLGTAIMVISKETNQVVSKRCEKMGIEVYYGVEDGQAKLDILKRAVPNCRPKDYFVAYVGDDLNDVPCLNFADVGITVADGHPRCKEVADCVTHAKGGEHAVREIAEEILKRSGITVLDF